MLGRQGVSLDDRRMADHGVFQLALRQVILDEGIQVIEDIFVTLGKRKRTQVYKQRHRGDRVVTEAIAGTLTIKWWMGTARKESGGKVMVSGTGMVYHRAMEEIA